MSFVNPNDWPLSGDPSFTPVQATPTVLTAIDAGTGLPRILYNGKAIDLPTFYRWQAYPVPAARRNVSPIGKVDTFLSPRMDIRCIGEFNIDDSASRRAQWQNFVQWALKGNPWALALDSSRTVDTTLTLDASGYTLEVADAGGLIVGEIYKLMHGYYRELVTIANVSGTVVTLDEPVLGIYPVGSKFRDQNFFPGVLREDSRLEIIDLEASEYQPLPQTRYRASLDFYEDSLTVYEYDVIGPVITPPPTPPVAEPTYIHGIFIWLDGATGVTAPAGSPTFISGIFTWFS